MFHRDKTGKAILIPMKSTHLELGLEQPFYNVPYSETSYLITPTWFTILWKYLESRELQLEITHQIVLSPPRQHDTFLVSIIHHHLNLQELQKRNKIRISLKLLYLSDITDIHGSHLLPMI